MIWLATLTVCLGDIWLNKWLIEHWRVIHWINGLYRVVAIGLLLWFFPMAWYLYPIYVIGAFTGYWMLFNFGLNFVRSPRMPLLHVGSGPKAALLDRFEGKHQTAVVLIRGVLAIAMPILWFWLK